jgi:hypothetical protein
MIPLGLLNVVGVLLLYAFGLPRWQLGVGSLGLFVAAGLANVAGVQRGIRRRAKLVQRMVQA